MTHPSEPDYRPIVSGSTNGIADDGVHDLAGKNIADRLEASGKMWRVSAENAPPNCFPGVVDLNPEDGAGLCLRKRNPAISFTDISGAAARRAHIADFSRFDLTAAKYALIIPNLCQDRRDCSVAVSDKFLIREFKSQPSPVFNLGRVEWQCK